MGTDICGNRRWRWGESGTVARRRRWRGRSTRISRYILLWPLHLLFLSFFLFPFYWQTITALKTPAEVEAMPVQWLPRHLYWGNFRAVLTDPGFLRAMLNSLLVATSTTVLALTLGAVAAYALVHLPLPHPRRLLVAVLIAASLPPIALVPSLYVLFRQIQWLDTYYALIAADLALALPFALWVLSAGFRALPAQLVEQAEVDGCTPAQVLRHVVWPLAAPGMAAAGLLIFITVWNEFLFALTFSLHPRMYTVTVAIGSAGGWGGMLAAASEVVTVPLIVVVLLGQRRIVQGLTRGAIIG